MPDPVVFVCKFRDILMAIQASLPLRKQEPINRPLPIWQELRSQSAATSRIDDVSQGALGRPFLDTPYISCRGVNAHYGSKPAVRDIGLDIGRKEAIALIGPSGCGKSTFLRCLNRMNDVIPGCKVSGRIFMESRDIYGPGIDAVELRARVAMVFQKPTPLPGSIFGNVAYGPRIHGLASVRPELEAIVEEALRRAGLWKEVKDRLHAPSTNLSIGQLQRLCIARAIAVNPIVILMDEPCSALDPIATAKIEQLIEELREHFTIVLVTHSIQQAGRVSQRTAYFHLGRLVEAGPTPEIFTNPRHPLTEAYLTGRIG